MPLIPAQDFKRRDDGDAGPNTGGMGAYAPLPWAPPDLVDEVLATVLQPTVDEMARRGEHFAGLLYAGLALTSRGVRVVEFNARFGDPETQVVLPLLDTRWARCCTPRDRDAGRAPAAALADGAAVTVVVAAPGYPEAPRTGDPITGADGEGVLHAGTALAADGTVVSAGGRVLAVTAVGADLAAARQSAYERVAGVRLAGAHWRLTSRWRPSRAGSAFRPERRPQPALTAGRARSGRGSGGRCPSCRRLRYVPATLAQATVGTAMSAPKIPPTSRPAAIDSTTARGWTWTARPSSSGWMTCPPAA